MKKILFSEVEIKILKMALVDDDMLQQHHAYIFNCHYLPDLIQHLRKKLKKYFDTSREVVKTNFYTEYRTVLKANGKKAKIGIFRLTPEWKEKVKILLHSQIDSETQNE